MSPMPNPDAVYDVLVAHARFGLSVHVRGRWSVGRRPGSAWIVYRDGFAPDPMTRHRDVMDAIRDALARADAEDADDARP